MCKSVSAFANTFGGALIFGIADNDKIVGLENPNSDAEKISEIIKTRMDPIPEFRLRFEQVEDGKVLIILDIFNGEETPYYYSGGWCAGSICSCWKRECGSDINGIEKAGIAQ